MIGIDDDIEDNVDSYLTWESASELSNSSFTCLFIQSLPLLVIYPFRRIIMWFLIATPWVYLISIGWGRFRALLAAMFIARLATGMIRQNINHPFKILTSSIIDFYH